MKIGALVAGFVLFTGLPLGAKSTLDLQVSPPLGNLARSATGASQSP